MIGECVDNTGTGYVVPVLSSAESCAFPFRLDVTPDPVSERHDRQDRIEASIRHVQAAVRHEEIVDLVKLTEAVGHGDPGVVAHPAGPRLVLSPAEAEARDGLPCPDRPGFLQPLLRL